MLTFLALVLAIALVRGFGVKWLLVYIPYHLIHLFDLFANLPIWISDGEHILRVWKLFVHLLMCPQSGQVWGEGGSGKEPRQYGQ